MVFLQSFGTIAFTIIFSLLSLFVYTKLAGPIPFSVNSITTQKSDAFTVTGEGKSNIKPDKATVRMGVTAIGTSADDAKNKMNLAINKVTNSIKALGIDEKDIQTENLNVYPNYSNTGSITLEAVREPAKNPNTQAISYTANTNITIKVNQIDLAEKVIDTGTQMGANQLGGVQFDSTDKTAAENDAREKAVASAKAKAELAAKTAGFSLGKIINYSENSGGGGPIMYAAKAADSAVPPPKTELNPGENEVVISVTLSYEVR
jgi:uncharacterized protein YggE